VAFFHVRFFGYSTVGSLRLVTGYGLATLGSCLVLFAFLGVSPRLLPGWAIYLGRISYGLYVFHVLAWGITLHFLQHQVPGGYGAVILMSAIALGLTVLLASLSYRFFESPFLRMKKRFEIVESRPV
jgi:peptidoglycan/LPS O-acetylase OafA/YrhL